MTITIKKEVQRRQYVLEHRPEGIFASLRWDGNVQRFSDPFPGNIEQAKRYYAMRLGDREPHEVSWSSVTVAGLTMEYSDVFLTDNSGGRLTPAELDAVRSQSRGKNKSLK